MDKKKEERHDSMKKGSGCRCGGKCSTDAATKRGASDNPSRAKDAGNETKSLATIESDYGNIDVKPGPIRDAAEELGVVFACTQGFCGSCIVEVLEGEENLTPKTENEEDMGLSDNERLCCQVEIKSGKIKIDW